MEWTEIKVRVTFEEEVLGVTPGDAEIYQRFIGSKGPNAKTLEEEIEALGEDAVLENGMTIFPKDEDGTPFSWDYQWKGFFKDACGMLRRADGSRSKKLKAYKKEIDGLVYVFPRKIPYQIPEGEQIGICERSLRAQTAQGERVALACSETVPAGSTQEFTIRVLKHELIPYVIEWLEYGMMHGTGAWRNSGKGRFTFEILEQ